jgi:hypothetical protein
MEREGREKMGSSAGNSFRRGGPDGGRRRTSGGRRRRECCGQDAEESDGLESLIGYVDCFLWRGRGASGEWRGRWRFGLPSAVRSCGTKSRTTMSEGAQGRGKQREAKERMRQRSTMPVLAITNEGIAMLR